MPESDRTPTTLTHEQWKAEAQRRFGVDHLDWRFVCPACGHVSSVRDWRDAGAPVNAAASSCVGRWLPSQREAFGEGPGPCNYAGDGLFKLNPVTVEHDGKTFQMFAFAEPEAVAALWRSESPNNRTPD